MIADLIQKEEKKVAYLELIYDLIFVYILGRSNSLLHTVQNGLIPMSVYLTYLMSTLMILQIWYFTTLYINRYGTGGAIETLGIFVNMYLLYYMAEGTRIDWSEAYYRYNVAWALILLNLAAMYLLRLLRKPSFDPQQLRHIRATAIALIAQGVLALATLPIYPATGIPATPFVLVAGVIAHIIINNHIHPTAVDFPHLTERVMLYVVFTFGEMIISLAEYFEGGMSFNTVYYSLMGFLIVAGLFLIYGYFYDHLIDREMTTTGTVYMLLHIVLIAALNHITVALELMREDEVNPVFKSVMISIALIVYFTFLFMLLRFSRGNMRPDKTYTTSFWMLSALFIVFMVVLYQFPAMHIAMTVVFIYTMLLFIILHARRHERKLSSIV